MDIQELYNIFLRHPQVTTDSRDCPQGSIFIALKGPSFNGNAFAGQALDQGCAYAVVDDERYYKASDNRYILAGNGLETLQQLAALHRRAIKAKVIAVTGTNGKTTTKELISAVLATKYNVLHTLGNLNNHIGVPKTLLRLNATHDFAIVEMGANHPGEIKTLTDIAAPDMGMITNVGRAHLQGFGSFEGVKRTKGELYDYLADKDDSVIFINADDKDLADMADERCINERISYGISSDSSAAVCGEVTSCAPFLNFRWKSKRHDGERSAAATNGDSAWHEVNTHVIGTYNLYNMLAAVTIGDYLGVDGHKICNALANYMPHNNRSQLTVTADNTLIVDAYNANPTSMEAALTSFCDMRASNKMVILGEMKELGDAQAYEHGKVIDFLLSAQFDTAWLVGAAYADAAEARKSTWKRCDVRFFHDVEEVREAISSDKPRGRCILIKGSHSTKLYELPALL